MDSHYSVQEEQELGKTVTLCLTEQCNLQCSYCYEHHKKESFMTFKTAKAIIDTEMTANDGFRYVVIEYFGGEPFVAFHLMKEIHEYLITHKWEKDYAVYVTTNGTLVHGEAQEWLKKNAQTIRCSLSLDGTKTAHNLNRSNSFDMIDIDFFAKTWPNPDIKMTISQKSLPYLAESVIFSHEKGFDVFCNLAYGENWDDPNNKTVLADQLQQLSSYYLEHPGIKPCSMLSLNIENVSSNITHISKWCGASTHMHTYGVDGTRYPCQFFMPLSLGDAKAKEAESLVFLDYISMDLLDKKCSICPFVSACPTCSGYNYLSTGSLYSKDDAQCELTKIMFAATAYLKYNMLKENLLQLSDNEKYALLNGIKNTQEYLFQDS